MSSEDRLVLSGRVPRSTRGRAQSSQPEYDLYYMRTQRVWHPPTDVYETDSVVVVKVEIAGMDEDGMDISITDRRLVIRGNRMDRAHGSVANDEAPAKNTLDDEAKVTYHNMEIHYGEFRSEVQINIPVDRAEISASYRDGFLYVTLPKPKTHRVQVSPSGEGKPDA
jgi:HSP20 family protein